MGGNFQKENYIYAKDILFLFSEEGSSLKIIGYVSWSNHIFLPSFFNQLD